jgi:hypothetical protein
MVQHHTSNCAARFHGATALAVLGLAATITFVVPGCGDRQAEEKQARTLFARQDQELKGVEFAREMMRTAKNSLDEQDPSDATGIEASVNLYQTASEKYLELGERVKKQFVEDCREAGISESVAQKVWSEGLRERDLLE